MPKSAARPNPAHLELVRDLCNRGPFQEHMGIHMTTLEEGRCRLEMQIERKHLNPFGGLCGGSFAALLDVACYWCIYPQIPEHMGATTLDLQMNYLRAANDGLLVCEAWVKKPGRSIFLCEAEVLDEQGRLLANASSKMFLSPDIQHVSAAVATVDPDLVLPPKFLEPKTTGSECA
jgi:uncharacterized protein (TIGR00369 family)